MDNKQAIKKLRSQRDEICNGCLHAVGWCESHCGFSEAIDMAIEALKQPEIIHCCECSSYGKSLSGKYMCLAHCTYPQPNHYCADGIRRTDG